MFTKKRNAMEVFQVVVRGVLLVALGALFATQFSDGIYDAGSQANDAVNTASGTFGTVNTILEAETGEDGSSSDCPTPPGGGDIPPLCPN